MTSGPICVNCGLGKKKLSEDSDVVLDTEDGRICRRGLTPTSRTTRTVQMFGRGGPDLRSPRSASTKKLRTGLLAILLGTRTLLGAKGIARHAERLADGHSQGPAREVWQEPGQDAEGDQNMTIE